MSKLVGVPFKVHLTPKIFILFYFSYKFLEYLSEKSFRFA